MVIGWRLLLHAAEVIGVLLCALCWAGHFLAMASSNSLISVSQQSVSRLLAVWQSCLGCGPLAWFGLQNAEAFQGVYNNLVRLLLGDTQLLFCLVRISGLAFAQHNRICNHVRPVSTYHVLLATLVNFGRTKVTMNLILHAILHALQHVMKAVAAVVAFASCD